MGCDRSDFQQPLTKIVLPIDTAAGRFVAVYSDRGLAELHFPAADFSCAASTASETGEWHEVTVASVRAVLEGKNPERVPPLDVENHSAFRQAVWAELRKLRCGETVSYGELAEQLGIPGGARAVGNACGANPIPLLIPCHRVLAAGGALGGFSGGLDWKRKLLLREGVVARELLGGTERVRTRNLHEPMLLDF
jgi:methylated-DNA-[protein]-cysteine S-methyltransferase